MRPFVCLLIFLFVAPVAGAAESTSSLRIIAINDFHGHLEADASSGGAVALAATLARLRTESPGAIFVSTGDLIGASPLPSALAHDEPTLAVFRQLGLAVNVIGNHELDAGVAELRRKERVAGFPFLSANLVDTARGAPAFAPYRVIEHEGLRIGLVGATVGNALQPLEPDQVPGLRLEEEAAALNAQARALDAAGVHVLVALLHEGAGAQDATIAPEQCASLAGRAREIAEALDQAYALVLSAHTHGRYACRVGGRWLAQAGSYGRDLTVADLRIAHGEVVGVAVRLEPVVMREAEVADAAVEKLVADAVVAAAKIADAPVAAIPGGRLSASDDGRGSPLGRLVARAQLQAGRALGAELACTNPSSVPRDLVASLPGNVASYADVRAVQPYGNRLKVRRVRGAQLRALVEQQWRAGERPRMLSCSPGLDYRLDDAQRVVPGTLTWRGSPLRDEDEVRMVLNSYLARGGQNFTALVEATEAGDAGSDLDALLSWLKVEGQP